MKNSFALRFPGIALSLFLLAPQIDAHEPVYARKGMVVAQEPLAETWESRS